MKKCRASGGGTPQLIRGQEVRRSRRQSIYVILNLFQDLLTGGKDAARSKDAKRRRGKANIKNKLCCNFTKIPINENSLSSCPPNFCSSDCTPPHPSPIGEGEEKNNPLSPCERAEFQCENFNSNIRNSGEGENRTYRLKNKLTSRFTLHPSLKMTYRPNVLTSYRLKKCAFTLSEVLITLGIIGVVAAMTIPTLISNHNKRVVETRLKKFYSSMNQAIRMAELDYGSRELWFEDNRDKVLQEAWVKKYIVPYMNVIKYVAPDGLLENRFVIYFSDGSAVAMGAGNGRDWFFFPGNPEKCEKLGNYTYSSYIGRCAFAFYYNPVRKADGSFYQWNFEPYMSGWDGTENSLKNHSNYGCNDDSGWPAYCTRWIQINGWRIPDDYPFRVKY